MSKLETNTIDTISGSTNLTLGGTNATDITIPAGVTITNNGTQSGFGGVNTPAFEARLGSTFFVKNNQTWSNINMTGSNNGALVGPVTISGTITIPSGSTFVIL